MTTITPAHPVPVIDLSEDHAEFRSSCRSFAEREIAPLVDDAERSGVYPVELRRKAAAAGFTGLGTPVEHGGAGAGMTFQVVAIEEFARVCAGLATGLTGGLGQGLLSRHATEAQRRRYLEPVIAGEASAAFAMTEPDAGSDVLNMKGRAVRTEAGWRITASKVYITGAPMSDYMFVVVYTQPEARARGLSVFLVDTRTPGIEIRNMDKLGHRSMETAEVFFDCEVGPDALLGEAGQGLTYIQEALESGRITHAARSVGVARAAYEDALEHARHRRAFGNPIADYQAIQFKLARMLLSVNTAQLHVTRAAQRYDEQQPCMLEACMAKVVASEAAVSVASDAMQVFGGLGYMSETPVQRYLRDAYLYPISEGTTEIQLRTVARLAGIVGEH